MCRSSNHDLQQFKDKESYDDCRLFSLCRCSTLTLTLTLILIPTLTLTLNLNLTCVCALRSSSLPFPSFLCVCVVLMSLYVPLFCVMLIGHLFLRRFGVENGAIVIGKPEPVFGVEG